MMNRLIEELAQNLQGYSSYLVEEFKGQESDQNYLRNVIFISNKGRDYFVFVELNVDQFNSEFIHEIQKQLHVYSKKNIMPSDGFELTEYYERNRTLIISVCLNENLITKENLRLIAEMEEDPYLFKKQIIALTATEFKGIDELLNKNSMTVLATCEDIVTNYDLFEDFKKEQGREIQKSYLYSLVATLYEKLPFMKYPIQEEQKQNLQSKIDEKLLEINLLDIKNSLLDLNNEDDYAIFFDKKFDEYKVIHEKN